MTPPALQRVYCIDSHTGGEPTRVVIDGGPDLGGGTLAERRELFRREFDSFRSAVVNEPRGCDALVGALLCEPSDETCAAGVIFFNNVGCINMCVHGAIGLVVTLAHLQRIAPGRHRIETPVGVVTATLHPLEEGEAPAEPIARPIPKNRENGGWRMEDGTDTPLYPPSSILHPPSSHAFPAASKVTIANVPSYRAQQGIEVDVDGYGRVGGDVAWGGNWFFLADNHGQRLELGNVERLTDFARRIRQALRREGITGSDGGEIDHVELFGPSPRQDCDSRNFVLCPGGAYDRSPCGTSTSAKLACLYADGKLAPGEVWRQESIVGSVFEGRVEIVEGNIVPHITGTAFVTAESTLLLDPRDPFHTGIRYDTFATENDRQA